MTLIGKELPFEVPNTSEADNIFIFLVNIRNLNSCQFIKGDISKFFIFHCKSFLYVGFYVLIKNPDHFPQCSVIKWV